MPAPPDTHARQQRASRPVLYDHEAILWHAVHTGVVSSVNVNERFELQALVPPPLHRCASPPMPPGPSPPPPPPPPPPPRRPVLGDVSINVLRDELKTLEHENAVLKKHVALQDNVINGLCSLHVYEHENIRPARR